MCCRPDLPPGYDGWQAFDTTPQECQEGILLPTSNFSDHINILSFDILQLYHLNTFNINGRDVQRKHVVNNVDKSSLWAP